MKQKISYALRLIYERDGGFCHLCFCKVDLETENPKLYATLDHLIPKARGGTRDKSNVKLAHAFCNNYRGSVNPSQFIKSEIRKAFLARFEEKDGEIKENNMKDKIVNTTVDENYVEWLFGANPRAIETQEARGQKQLVCSEMLPSKFNQCTREEFEALGFVFGEPEANDTLFVKAKLPDGWKKRATEHSMWSEIVDETGTVRATMFYKAAFYDRDAFLELVK